MSVSSPTAPDPAIGGNRAGRCFEPDDESELVDAIRQARSEGLALELRGGGTRERLGHAVRDAAPLSLAGLRGITSYEPGALTLIARAGTPLAEVQAELAAANQRLPFEPMDHRPLFGTSGEPTIGGVVACNVSGPRRVRAGACRDSLLGIRFVDGTGRLVKSGGRVMKNVTGYDLVKVLCGSHGTLGAIAEVVYKVLPAPEREATLAIDGLSPSEAVDTMRAALGAPLEVDGAAHHTPGDGRTLLRVTGFAEQVSSRLDRLRTLIGRDGEVIEGDAHTTCWREVRDVTAFENDDRDVWRFSVRPSDAPRLVERLATRFSAETLLDWGGGLVWAAWQPDADEGDPRTALDELDGHGMPVRVAARARDRHPVFLADDPRLDQVSRALRDAFDPDGILNPGRMG